MAHPWMTNSDYGSEWRKLREMQNEHLVEPASLILVNSVFIVILAFIILGLIPNYGNDYHLGFVDFIIISACMFFLALGAFLFISGEYHSILLLNKLLSFISLPLLNKLLPFISLLGFFMPQGFTDELNSEVVTAISTIVSVLIILAIYITAVTVLIKNRSNMAQGFTSSALTTISISLSPRPERLTTIICSPVRVLAILAAQNIA